MPANDINCRNPLSLSMHMELPKQTIKQAWLMYWRTDIAVIIRDFPVFSSLYPLSDFEQMNPIFAITRKFSVSPNSTLKFFCCSCWPTKKSSWQPSLMSKVTPSVGLPMDCDQKKWSITIIFKSKEWRKILTPSTLSKFSNRWVPYEVIRKLNHSTDRWVLHIKY